MNLEALRAFCLTLPGTTEDVKWQDHLCFSVGGKMYYVTSFTHPTSSLKVPDERFDVISSMEGIIPAPYMARNKWVQISSLDRFSQSEWEHYIRQSYELVKSKLPKKVQEQLGTAKSETKKSETKKRETKKKETKKKETKKKRTRKSETKIKSAAKEGTSAKKAVKKVSAKKAAKKTPAKKSTSPKPAVKKKTSAKKASPKKPKRK